MRLTVIASVEGAEPAVGIDVARGIETAQILKAQLVRETAVKFLEHDLRPLLPDGAWSTDRVDLVPQFPRHDRRFLRKVAAQQLQLADEVLPAGVGAHEFGHIVGKPAVIFPVDRVFKACRSGEKFCVRPGIQASKMFQREFDPYVVRFGDVDQRMEVGEFVLREEAGVFRLQLKERDPHPDADEIAAVLKERGVDWIGLVGEPGTESFYRNLGFEEQKNFTLWKL